MEPAALLVVLLFALTTTLPISAQGIPAPVQDLGNGMIRVGNTVYQVPLGGQPSGWQVPAATNNRWVSGWGSTDYGRSNCTVMLAPAEAGVPIRLTGCNKDGQVLTGEPLDIEFVFSSGYTDTPNKWVMVKDDSTDSSWVGVGGAQYYPGMRIVDGTFRLEQGRISVPASYHLMFCPNDPTAGGCFGLNYRTSAEEALREGLRLVPAPDGVPVDEFYFVKLPRFE